MYGSPTVINNVETLSSAPEILRRGGEWYAGLGSPKNGGTRLFCVSGHVNKPGIYELPMGFPLRKIIEDVAGGMRNGRKLKAIIPGGSSCPLLTADEIDINMDYDSVAKAGSMLGSGGLVVIDEDTCMVDLARRIMHFYAHESCGWCIPCREGTGWLRKMLDRFHAGFGPPGRYSPWWAIWRKTCWAARSARWAMPPRCPPSASSRNGGTNLKNIFPENVRTGRPTCMAAVR